RGDTRFFFPWNDGAMTSANLTREETAARSASVTVRSVSVELDLRDAPDQQRATFGVTTTLHFVARDSDTWIDFIGESVSRLTVNGVDQEVHYEGARLPVRGLAADNTVVIEATGLYSRSGEGLHRFVDPVDEQTYLYTQYEPADARRVMACFEQPDMKASYTFRVHAPTGWHVLSNQQAIDVREHEGVQTVEFAPTL